jgi:NADH-quinone oxidoreductase subunit A
LFDVELIFLFPWSTIFADKNLIANVPNWAMFNMIEMSIFIFILLLGLVYVWRKGDLEWIRPTIQIPSSNSLVPIKLYEEINNTRYTVKEFTLEVKLEPTENIVNTGAPVPSGVRRPPFRSAVKKETNE